MADKYIYQRKGYNASAPVVINQVKMAILSATEHPNSARRATFDDFLVFKLVPMSITTRTVTELEIV